MKKIFALLLTLLCINLTAEEIPEIPDDATKTVTCRIYDEQNREIYCKSEPDNYETIHKYDAQGNLVYMKTGQSETWYEYNGQNKLIYVNYDNETDEIHGYDAQGNEIYYFDNSGNRTYTEYYTDENGESASQIFKGTETWSEYDEKGNLIHIIYFDGSEKWMEYDENNRCTHECYIWNYRITYTTAEEWKEYDQNGLIIHYRDDSGREYWNDYNPQTRTIVHRENNTNYTEYTIEFDSENRIIHEKENGGRELFITYDEEGDYATQVLFAGDEEARIEFGINMATIRYERIKSGKKYLDVRNIVNEKGDILYSISVLSDIQNEEGKPCTQISQAWYSYEYDERGNMLKCINWSYNQVLLQD